MSEDNKDASTDMKWIIEEVETAMIKYKNTENLNEIIKGIIQNE
jgi:hypothetical protein